MNKQEMEVQIKKLAEQIASENPNLIEDVKRIIESNTKGNLQYFIPDMKKPEITVEDELIQIQEDKNLI
jgi:hypothetical protein